MRIGTAVKIQSFCMILVGVFIATGLIGVPTVKAIGGANIHYSEGTRSGVVQKFSKKGMFWSTWEGEMNLGYNTQSDEGQIRPAIWEFSCSSEEVAKKIQDAEKSGKRLTLEYEQFFLRGYKYGGTSYDVKGVAE